MLNREARRILAEKRTSDRAKRNPASNLRALSPMTRPLAERSGPAVASISQAGGAASSDCAGLAASQTAYPPRPDQATTSRKRAFPHCSQHSGSCSAGLPILPFTAALALGRCVQSLTPKNPVPALPTGKAACNLIPILLLQLHQRLCVLLQLY